MNVICQSLVNLLKRWALFQIHGSGDWVKRSRLKRSVANLSRRFPDALGLAVGEPTEQKDPALSRRAEETRRRDAHAGDLCMVWFCDEARRPRCLARTRRGTPCQSPAVAGKTRCRMHGGAAGSGAPKGKRNGKYRHGGFTTEAIDERRRLAALIRDSRDFLSRLR
jgi:hypothetical protein